MNTGVANTYLTERQGISAVAMAAAQIGLIWRETNTGDIGIDGQLEHVTEGPTGSGQLIGVQVKAGTSYFGHPFQHGWRYYPSERHRTYWERYPIPVLLVLHNPTEKISYWADIRQQLRASTAPQSLFVPKTNILQRSTAEQLFLTAGVADQPLIPRLEDVVRDMVRRHSNEASFPISYFDLFAHGLTNLARSVYYGMDLALTVAESRVELGIGLGSNEHEFLFGFIKYLMSQNLADIKYSDCLIDWEERQVQPHFVAPLTSRGRELVKTIHAMEEAMVANQSLEDEGYVHVAQDAFFQMVGLSYEARMPRILQFQKNLLQPQV